MNLRWNAEQCRFEAELGSGGFKADLEAVKAAGFKCDGPPSWVWATASTLPLRWLREHRPPVLTIEVDARTQYESRLALDEANEKIKAQAATLKKEQRKERAKQDRQEALVECHIPAKGYIDKEDLPPLPPFKLTFVRPDPPTTKCFVCDQPVYPYEYAEGATPACLWCQKNVLDNSGEL